MTRAAVIGTGPSGLAAIKAFKDEGFQVTAFEQNSWIGGIWKYDPRPEAHSSAYASLKTNTPKQKTQYKDFEMPENYDQFPKAAQVVDYLESYATHFDLRSHIIFNRKVTKVTKTETGWQITTQDTLENSQLSTDLFDAVAVCSGHYWKPVIPKIEGQETFAGTQIHSHSYKEPSSFIDKKVVIYGLGISGREISKELAHSGATVLCSTKRRNTFANNPSSEDVSICMHAEIVRMDKNGVYFADGTYEECDAVVYCTGYELTFAFFDADILRMITRGNRVALYKHVIHPDLPGLGFLGFLTTNSSIHPIVEAQAKFFAAVISERIKLPPKLQMHNEIEMWTQMIEEYKITYRPNEVTNNSYLADLYSILGQLDDELAKYL